MQRAAGQQVLFIAVPGFHQQLCATALRGAQGRHLPLGQGEGHGNRLGLGDHRQHRAVVGRQQVAGIQLAQTDAAADRRLDLAELQVKTRFGQGRLVAFQRTLVLPHQCLLGIQCLLGDTLLGIQAAVARQVDLGVLQLGLVLQQGALGLLHRHLVGARIDLRQQLTGLDHLPFLEQHPDQLATDPGTHIDRIERRHRTQRLFIDGEISLHHLSHAHRHRAARTAGASRTTRGN